MEGKTIEVLTMHVHYVPKVGLCIVFALVTIDSFLPYLSV